MARSIAILVLLLSVVGRAPAAADDAARARIDSISREVADGFAQSREEAGPSSGLLQDRLGRLSHGAWSLVIPGWSQYRSGHTSRAVAFASVEVLVWGSYLFSELQGRYREDQYREFAGFYAGVRDTDRDDDDYWRAVGLNVDSDEFNATQRIENRAEREEQILNGEEPTVGPNDGLIAPENGWEWNSERRRSEYLQRRADALSSFDRANISLLFALINRIVAFADAARSGPPSDGDDTALIRTENFDVGVDFRPDPIDPSAEFSLGTRF